MNGDVARRSRSAPLRWVSVVRASDALPLLVVCAVYLAAALVTLHNWQVAGFALTGDEPHYLVMTRGIVVDHTFEQTAPYREVFEQGLFSLTGSPDGSAGAAGAATTDPSPLNTHAYLGPHGLFNIHNIGLPLLLALPYAALGVIGVRIFLILVGAMAVALFYRISGVFTEARWVRVLSTLAVGVVMPLIAGGNQVFPDIPAGVIVLAGLWWLLTVAKRRPLWMELLLGTAIAYLPLLQIKFAAPALVLVVALGVAIARREGQVVAVRAWVVVVPFVVLLGIQFAYNLYAFANLTGPYEPGSFEIGPSSVMVFAGLLLDQNQGLLFQSPIAFAGLVGAGLLVRRRRGFALAWVGVLLALTVPNSLLANHYGGYSFAGRFGYAAALAFGVATLCALSALARASRRWFVAVVAAGLLCQAAFFAYYAFSPELLANSGRVLYNPDPEAWLQNYSLLYYPFEHWLPALYNEGWAFAYLPNLAWALVAVALVVAGWRAARRVRLWMPVGAVLVVAVAVAGLVSPAPLQPLFVQQNVTTPAAAGQTAGLVTDGPSILVREGRYTVQLTYSSPADPSTVVGSWEPALTGQNAPWSDELRGTNGMPVTLVRYLVLTNRVPVSLQLRTSWNGVSELTIDSEQFALTPTAP